MQAPHPLRWLHDRLHREVDIEPYEGLPRDDARKWANQLIERMENKVAQIAARENFIKSEPWREIEETLANIIVQFHEKAAVLASEGKADMAAICLDRAHTLNQFVLGVVGRELLFAEHFRRRIKNHEYFKALLKEK